MTGPAGGSRSMGSCDCRAGGSGPVEAGVEAEIAGLTEARPGIAQAALAMARVLDNPRAVNQQPPAAKSVGLAAGSAVFSVCAWSSRQLLSQFQHRHQARRRHQIVLVKHRRLHTKHMR
jgi:hypothetical protein